MSHLVTIETKVHDHQAVTLACQRLKLPQPVVGTGKLYSGDVTGLILQLPGWEYPAVIDTLSGRIHYDNFGGRWGEERHLHQFLQMYAVEKARLEATRRGHVCSEQQLADGSIRLSIREVS